MFPPMIIAGGNIPKIPNVSYTAPYVIFLRGCRLVPYNVTHDLKVIRDTFTDDGFSGRDVFDRTPLSPTTHINIDFEVPQVEVRVVTVNTGSGLTTEQDAILRNAESASLIASAESSKARKMQTNKAVISPDDLIVTIYDDDKTSPLHVFDISLDKKARVPQ